MTNILLAIIAGLLIMGVFSRVLDGDSPSPGGDFWTMIGLLLFVSALFYGLAYFLAPYLG
jgi:hypothetical protein